MTNELPFSLPEFITSLWAGGLLTFLVIATVRSGEARKPHNPLLVAMLSLLAASYFLFAVANHHSAIDRRFLVTFFVADGFRVAALAAGAHFLFNLFPMAGIGSAGGRRAFAGAIYAAALIGPLIAFHQFSASGKTLGHFPQLHSAFFSPSGWFPVWWVLIIPQMNALIAVDRAVRRARGEDDPYSWWHGRRPSQPLQTVFHRYEFANNLDFTGNPELTWVTRRERTALLVLLVGVCFWMALHALPESTVANYLVLLFPFVLTVPYLYVRCRFAFFDVFLKTGIVATLVTASGFAFLLAGVPWKVCLLILAFTAAWLLLVPAIYGVLNHLLLSRPDYRRLREPYSDLIRRALSPAELTSHLAQVFQHLLRAEYCRFVTETPSDGEHAGVFAVATPERSYGYFVMGPRHRGQPFQSEDLAFLEDLCRQAATMLRNFELRDVAHTAELKALKAQINPHFLFNALNTLAHVTAKNPKLAEQLTLDLAHVFRYALTAAKRETITLAEEAEFLASYLDVEKARFEERLHYRIEIPEALRQTAIPPMLIQPLVENSIRHGFAGKLEGGRLTVTAASNDGWLRVTVTDDGVGFDPSVTLPNTGLANVRARVEALYGRFQVQSSPGRGAEVSFEVKP